MKLRAITTGLAAALAITCAPTPPAHADLTQTLTSMLGNNVQVNSPGAISTSRRGGFYGGSVYVRGRVMNVNVINFTPPSFTAGCGGIDLFGGSFSMINKEQFVALLRSIAQNAAGYAFHLALKNICEQCSTIIANLQNVVQAANEFTGNSCQLAKGIVNGGIAALELHDIRGVQSSTVASGFQDSWDAFWGSLASTVESASTPNSDGSADIDRFEVNVVWEAMRSNGMEGWFQSGDRRLMEAIMTLTGTIVVQGPTNDGGEVSRQVTPAVSGGNLTIRDLIYGNPNARILRCSNLERCLTMTTNSNSLDGLRSMLEQVLVGNGPADPNSLLFKLTNGTGTGNDAGVLIGRLGTYGSMLLSLAQSDTPGGTAAYTMFQEMKDYLAFELANLFISEVFVAVDQAVSSNNYETAYAMEWRRNEFQQAYDRMSNDLRIEAENVASPLDFISTYISLKDHLIAEYSPLE